MGALDEVGGRTDSEGGVDHKVDTGGGHEPAGLPYTSGAEPPVELDDARVEPGVATGGAIEAHGVAKGTPSDYPGTKMLLGGGYSP